MKILAADKRNETFIISATASELANLVGYYSDYQMARESKSLEVGDEIQVAKMFQQLYDLTSKKRELEDIRGKLVSAAKLLELEAPVVTCKPDGKEEVF